VIGSQPFQKDLAAIVKTADSELLEMELLDIQRWEDEGGQGVENSDSGHAQIPIHLVSIPARKHATALQWDKRWNIEPFQPGNGILREDMNTKGKSND
jgi:hypothetical protein